MLTFRTTPHSIRPGVEIVEILIAGSVVGVITPDDQNGMRIISAHFEQHDIEPGFAGEAVYDDGTSGTQPPIPAIAVTFNSRPYRIEDGKLVRP
jgi:hypothetical protein